MKLLHEFVFASPDVGDIVAATDMVNYVQCISFFVYSGALYSLLRFINTTFEPFLFQSFRFNTLFIVLWVQSYYNLKLSIGPFFSDTTCIRMLLWLHNLLRKIIFVRFLLWKFVLFGIGDCFITF